MELNRATLVAGVAGLLLVGGGIGGGAVAVAAPTHTVTRTVTVKDPHQAMEALKWRGCSFTWENATKHLASYAAESLSAMVDAITSGDYATATRRLNANTAKVNTLNASIPDACKQQ